MGPIACSWPGTRAWSVRAWASKSTKPQSPVRVQSGPIYPGLNSPVCRHKIPCSIINALVKNGFIEN